MQRETSTEDQIRECREGAQKQGWIVMDEFIRSDEAKSGQSLLGRDGLEELVNLAQQKDCPFDGIVVYDTSRLGRNLTDGLKLIDILKYAEVFLYFTTRDLDSRDSSFRTIFIQYGHKDEEYCVDVAERVHRGQRGRVLKGYVAAGRAYGYKNIPVPSADGTKWRHGRAAIDGVRREIVPEEAAVVRRIFEMYAAGLGQQAIALKLNEDGIRSPAKPVGRPETRWCTTMIAQTLRNSKYIGVNTWNQTKVIQNPITQKKEVHKRPESEWERVEIPEWRIVCDELWEAVATERRIRRDKTAKKLGGLNRTEASRRYIFSGLLACEGCGKPFIAYRTAEDDVRYQCGGGRTGTCPIRRSISLTLVESQLLPAISQCVHDDSVRDDLILVYRDQMVSQWNESLSSHKSIVDSEDQLRKDLRDLNIKAKNIVDALQDDGRNPMLVQRLKGIQEKITEIDTSLQIAAEVVTVPLTEIQTKDLVTRKLADIDAALKEPPDVLKHRLAKHIDQLKMKLVETPEGPKYEVTGVIRLFATGDPDDVLLAASLKRSCKQYTPLSFPFQATLIVRADEWKGKSKG
jgi:DNA invertase Pin-like site-specific DNA recombinase